MKLEEILNEWDLDSKIDHSELTKESLKISQLHSKYYKMYINERLMFKKLKSDWKVLYKLKFEYYNGTISNEDLISHALEPFGLKVIRSDLSVYLEADADLNILQNKMDIQEEKINFLESIIKTLTARGYNIKSAIDFLRFTNGQ